MNTIKKLEESHNSSFASSLIDIFFFLLLLASSRKMHALECIYSGNRKIHEFTQNASASSCTKE